jgi:hypothetical protein
VRASLFALASSLIWYLVLSHLSTSIITYINRMRPGRWQAYPHRRFLGGRRILHVDGLQPFKVEQCSSIVCLHVSSVSSTLVLDRILPEAMSRFVVSDRGARKEDWSCRGKIPIVAVQ